MHYYAQPATISFQGKEELVEQVIFDLFAENNSLTDVTDITTSKRLSPEVVYKNRGTADPVGVGQSRKAILFKD